MPIWGTTMLRLEDLSVSYGQHRALETVSLNVDRGEIVVILGANGAGKSTLLRAVGGTCEGEVTGEITVDGLPIAEVPSHEIVRHGIALVPEGRGIFPELTVHENLVLGAYSDHARTDERANLDRVVALFPILGERRSQVAGTMSGGEQQMVAIGRALMSAPQILLLDEPSLGLSPKLCGELFHKLAEIRDSGLGILLVEQNAKQSLAIANRGYLLENARIVGEGLASDLSSDPNVQAAYLGVSHEKPRKSSVSGAPATDVPAEPRRDLQFMTAGGALPRTNVNEVIPGGISNLVRRAATRQSDQYGDEPVSTRAAGEIPVARETNHVSDGSGEDRLAAVLAEIEQAAANARLPSAISDTEKTAASSPKTIPAETESAPNGEMQTRNGAAGPDEAGKTVETGPSPRIEHWKRQPNIEIYRRQGNDMKRVDGDENG